MVTIFSNNQNFVTAEALSGLLHTPLAFYERSALLLMQCFSSSIFRTRWYIWNSK